MNTPPYDTCNDGIYRPFFSLLVVTAALGAVVPASAMPVDVRVTTVESSIEQPAPGERFTLRVNVSNLASSSGPVEVTDVFVGRTGTTSELVRVEDIGTVGAGDSLTIPLTTSLTEAGGKRLTVSAVVEDAEGESRRVSYPLFLEVREPDETLLSVIERQAVVEQERQVNVTVANGDTAAISNVRLELGGDATIENPERIRASLAAGTQTTFTFQTTFERAGERFLDATLTYTTGEGSTRTAERTTPIDVEAATVDPTLEASLESDDGSPAIQATLDQFGNVALRDVQLQTLRDGELVSRTTLQDVRRGGRQAVTLDGSELSPGNVTLVAAFTAAGDRQTVRETLQLTSDVGLTVDRGMADETNVLTAELRQFGDIPVRDVRLRAEHDGQTVARATISDVPGGESRVGTLDAGAIPPGNVTVVADYRVGGERHVTRETLELRSDVQLSASSRVVNGTSAIVTELRQFGDVPLRDVRIRVEKDGRPVARTALPDVVGGGARTAVVDDADLPAGNLTVIAEFEAGSEPQTAATSVRYSSFSPAPTSAVTFTDVQVSREGETLRIEGDAANVGTSRVSSVVVGVVETESVSRVDAQREFFIGGIDAAQFERFQSSARAPSDVEEVSLRVAYTVGGQRVATILPVDVNGVEDSSTGGTGSGDGGSLLLGVGLVVLVLALAVGVYRWRF
jgi:hypothetical protein